MIDAEAQAVEMAVVAAGAPMAPIDIALRLGWRHRRVERAMRRLVASGRAEWVQVGAHSHGIALIGRR